MIMFFFPLLFPAPFLLPLMKHPLSLGLTILLLTLFMSTLIGAHLTAWYGYILFLIFIGGLLVMFIYVATLSPNASFKANTTITILSVLQMLLLPLIYLESEGMQAKTSVVVPENTLLYNTGAGLMSSVSILVGLGVILFIALVAVEKITTSSSRSSLRPWGHHGRLRALS